jgi:hypothetical protein
MQKDTHMSTDEKIDSISKTENIKNFNIGMLLALTRTDKLKGCMNLSDTATIIYGFPGARLDVAQRKLNDLISLGLIEKFMSVTEPLYRVTDEVIAWAETQHSACL